MYVFAYCLLDYFMYQFQYIDLLNNHHFYMLFADASSYSYFVISSFIEIICLFMAIGQQIFAYNSVAFTIGNQIVREKKWSKIILVMIKFRTLMRFNLLSVLLSSVCFIFLFFALTLIPIAILIQQECIFNIY